jgi:hypothetical protein
MTAQIPLIGGNYYHVYNRGNNGETIFCDAENFRYFLRWFTHHIEPVATTFAFSFQNLFIAYAQAFNRRYKRTGSLFQKLFKRRLADSDRYFAALVRYIHRNPQKLGLISDFREWPWSSYRVILDDQPTRILRADVLVWFGGRTPFIALHETDPDSQQNADYVIEHGTDANSQRADIRAMHPKGSHSREHISYQSI